jgi:hypothetical protein
MKEEKNIPESTPQVETATQNFSPDSKLTHDQALTVLVNAARIGQERGVYTLEEAEMIAKSIRVFVVPAGPTPSAQ